MLHDSETWPVKRRENSAMTDKPRDASVQPTFTYMAMKWS